MRTESDILYPKFYHPVGRIRDCDTVCRGCELLEVTAMSPRLSTAPNKARPFLKDELMSDWYLVIWLGHLGLAKFTVEDGNTFPLSFYISLVKTEANHLACDGLVSSIIILGCSLGKALKELWAS